MSQDLHSEIYLDRLRKHQDEIDMVKRNPKEYSSAFYIMQKLRRAKPGCREARAFCCGGGAQILKANVHHHSAVKHHERERLVVSDVPDS